VGTAMAGKLPWMKFYPGDWILDMDRHPLEIEGAWIRICCHLHRSKTYGKLSMTLDEWADVLRVDKDKTKEILRYLCVTKIATSRTDNGNVTVECRRMIGDDKDREQNKMRQQRYRDKHSKDRYVTDESRKNNGEETRVQRLETRDQRLENKNNTPLPPLGGAKKFEQVLARVQESWNSAMGAKVNGVAKGRVSAMKRNLGLDSAWETKYHEAAPMFSEVDDSHWPGGKFTFEFTLRMYNHAREYDPVVDRVLSGVYKPKTKPQEKYKVEEVDPEAEKKKAEAAQKKAEEERIKQEEDRAWNRSIGIPG